ncbi:MAG TPA: AI-2E family transporter, partial [Salinimicrobium sp.]|nr:AI-2E family transporter [Salinimicrobium sp.]
MTKGKTILSYSVYIVIGTYFLFLGLDLAKAFLAPLVTAVILSLLMLPLANRMERKISRISSSLLNTFLLFLVSLGFLALISMQVKNFISDWSQIRQTLQPKIEQMKDFVYEHIPLEQEDLKSESTFLLFGIQGNSAERASGFLKAVLGFLADYLLTFIYIFFLLNYRHRFREFLLRLFSKRRQGEV